MGWEHFILHEKITYSHCSSQFVYTLCLDFLTHCVLVDHSIVTCWTSPFVILRESGLFCRFYSSLLANSVDPDQTPHDVAPDLGLHCLPMIHLRVSR